MSREAGGTGPGPAGSGDADRRLPSGAESSPRPGEVSERASTRGGVANGMAAVVGTGLAFAITFVITRTYGVEATGAFFGAVALFMVVATATKLGVETALVMYIARLRAAGSFRAARSLVTKSVVVVAAVSAAAALVLYWAAPALSELLTEPGWQPQFAQAVRALAPFTPIWAISLCLLGATRGTGTMVPTAYGLGLCQPALQLALVAWAAASDASMATVARAFAAPLLATVAIAAVALARRLAGDRTLDDPTPADPPAPTDEDHSHEATTGFWSYALWRGLAGTLQMGLDRVGILIIGAVSTAAVAGQWAAITRLVGVAQRVFHAIGQALNPRIAALAERGDWAAVNRVADRITNATLLPLLPGLVGLICFPKSALGLFGAGFETGATGLQVAAAAVLVASLLAHADNVLLMAGHARMAMANTAVALAVAAGGYLALTPSGGVIGAALAFSAGVLAYRLASTIEIARMHQARVYGRRSMRTMGIGALTLAGPMVVVRLLGHDELTTAVAGGLIAVGCYAIALGLQDRSLAPEPATADAGPAKA